MRLNDRDYMRLALELAQRGAGWTAPNPMVGAVIVRDGRILGQGWHERCGQAHAERSALASCTEDPRGAELYVTLEPCCHYGRQPPCTDAILAAGIRRVVVGSGDPNPLVAGKGLELLRARGVEVVEHVLEEECVRLNQVFFHYIRTGRPFVVMKYAMTMDGKIAAHTGASQWITGEEARAHVQAQRHRLSAIMVGVGTVLADDPSLTCRLPGGRSPLRVVCDTRLRTPLTARVVATADEVPTLLATCCADEKKRLAYERAGCRVLRVGERDGHVDLDELMARLGRAEIDSVLLEGGRHPELGGPGAGCGPEGAGVHRPQAAGRAGGQDPGGGDGRPPSGGRVPAGQHHGHPAGGGLFDGERGDLSCLPGSLRRSGRWSASSGAAAPPC